MSLIEKLPNEVLLDIFDLLTIKDLYCCASVCQRFRQISYEEKLWSTLNLSDKKIPIAFIEQILIHGTKYLSLAGTKIYGEKLEISNGQHLQYNLKYLDLTECKVRPVTLGSPGNGDECLLDLTSHCYDLEKLSLAKLNLSNPKWLENIVQNSPTLRVLDLGYCTGLRFDTISSIVAKCRELTELNLDGTYLDQESISFLCRNLSSKLQKLSLYTLKVTDQDLENLVYKCSKIMELNLYRSSITG